MKIKNIVYGTLLVFSVFSYQYVDAAATPLQDGDEKQSSIPSVTASMPLLPGGPVELTLDIEAPVSRLPIEMAAWLQAIRKPDIEAVQAGIDAGLRSKMYYQADCNHLRKTNKYDPFMTALMFANGEQWSKDKTNRDQYIAILKLIYHAGDCDIENGYPDKDGVSDRVELLRFLSFSGNSDLAQVVLDLNIPGICSDSLCDCLDRFSGEVADRIRATDQYKNGFRMVEENTSSIRKRCCCITTMIIAMVALTVGGSSAVS